VEDGPSIVLSRFRHRTPSSRAEGVVLSATAALATAPVDPNQPRDPESQTGSGFTSRGAVLASTGSGLFGLVRTIGGVCGFIVKTTVDSVLVLTRLKHLPPTGNPVWWWRVR
jgi:hypothetical protein